MDTLIKFILAITLGKHLIILNIQSALLSSYYRPDPIKNFGCIISLLLTESFCEADVIISPMLLVEKTEIQGM